MFDNAILDYFKRASRNQDLIVQAIGNAILESNALLKEIEEQIAMVETRLQDFRKQAQNLIELAITKGISEGTTYKTKMTELENEITKLEDKLGKLQADKSVTQITAHSGQFLHQNLRFAMEHIDTAPPDAQKGLIRALIQEIVLFDDKLHIKMFVDQYIADTIAPHVKEALNEPVPINEKRPVGIASDEALTANGGISPNRPQWLPGVDAKRFTQHQCVQLVVKIFRYRNRGVLLTLGDPLPEKTPIPKPAPMNIIAKAQEIKAYIASVPQRTHLDAALHFKVTRARISQMMKIIDSLPADFTNRMSQTNDRKLLNRFSGKTLLGIAAMPGMTKRQAYLQQTLAVMNQ
jgi:hypothetical protein